MKITFPNMGYTHIGIKVLLDTLGLEYVVPPGINKKTLEYGVLNSPEFMCLPFKTTLGDMIYGLENGADIIIFGGGCGQCRLGYYADLQFEILKQLGYKFELIMLDFNNISVGAIIDSFKPVLKHLNKLKIAQGFIFCTRILYLTELLNKLANHVRCREIKKGQADSILKRFNKEIHRIKGYSDVKAEIKKAMSELMAVPQDEYTRPLKIAIVGEIYIASDPNVNLNIEKKLGDMGVEVVNYLGVAEWIREHLISLFPIKHKNLAMEAATEFFNTDDIGGHGLHTVGNTILSAKAGFDGVIHLYPFTCMPEIVAKTTFDQIQNSYNIPILTLSIDEMTGEAGYMTRLEAFVDMLEMRKAAVNS